MADEGEPAPHQPFPVNPDEFDADDRISFSKLSKKFVLETQDGQEFEFEASLRRWVPVVDEQLLQRQQQAYAVEGVDETEPATQPRKKRKRDGLDDDMNGGGAKSKTKADQKPRERKNTAVWITNLPDDVDVEEVKEVFSQCGVIAENIDSKEPRIKLYYEPDGRFSGNALVVYFRAESVNLAVQMLDDSDFRLGQTHAAGRMRVSVADFSHKAQKEPPAKTTQQDKQKLIKKSQKLNSKLADWDDDDPSTEQASAKWDKIVVLKHMFTLDELQEDPAAVLDIKEDVRRECGKIGDVTNVVLYDEEPDGVVTVRFTMPEAARACVQVLKGRRFSGQPVIAYVPDSKVRFRKSRARDADEDGDLDDLIGRPGPASHAVPPGLEAGDSRPETKTTAESVSSFSAPAAVDSTAATADSSTAGVTNSAAPATEAAGPVSESSAIAQ